MSDTKGQNGKGDKPRPVKKSIWDKNFDNSNWGRPKDKNIKSGFVHVPLMESQAAEFPGLPVLSIEMMLNAIKIMIAEVQRQ